MTHDRDIIRRLSGRWMELAGQPVMAERKRLWTALKDLRAERAMVLFETWSLLDYVSESELECADPALRGIERHMRWVIRQAEEVGDDTVVEPVWRVGWQVHGTDYGVPIEAEHARDAEGDAVAYRYNHPIRTPSDVDKLRPREWRVDREGTLEWVATLERLFGDILPVTLHGTQSLHAGLTGELFRLIGNDNLMVWVYDEPDAIRRIMEYLRDDRIAQYRWLEAEGLLGLNSHWTFVGSGSPGYVTALPQNREPGSVRLSDLWVWMESQESAGISPSMFARAFLPYMADVARLFGLVYYGCCEAVHDRWDHIIEAIPNVRAVSVSPWCDMQAIAAKLGRNVVFSRKPRPAPISGEHADWDGLREDARRTIEAARDCNLEIVYRDVYKIGGDRTRLSQWVEMVRGLIG
ncbi:MAG: hypothetical protein FJX72_07560 [Armatimonadetes bacterium]|nr:hypothetical protein [Armatimonadota bacterium]